jgi:glycyl-tRNA synthetase
MSNPLFNTTAQLRWWSEEELEFRDIAVKTLHSTIKTSLLEINRAWNFRRIEAPTLVPRSSVAQEYSEEDLWMLRADISSEEATMRPETTPTSYLAATQIITQGKSVVSEKEFSKRLPLCVWQVGKSFRREKSDGANAAKLRYFEFNQAEWQCIYGLNTMADYREKVLKPLTQQIAWLTNREARVIPSDRLPKYSEQTDDIEVLLNGRWTEMASISTRTDFDNAKVLEIAVGIDRVVEAADLLHREL